MARPLNNTFAAVFLTFAAILPAAGCRRATMSARGEGDGPSGKLIVFHAGSLAVPFKDLVAAFNEEYPDVAVVREAAGSRSCARKISDLGRPCDVMASADYTVIEELLIPRYADWVVKFATNEMAIVFGKRPHLADRIDRENWHEILARDDVSVGRSDRNTDPCGYRAVLVIHLAEAHYGVPGLADRLLAKDRRYIRPKETDLLALLEQGEIDYAFLYRSIPEQHGLRYLRLPVEVNLGYPEFAGFYKTASVQVSGKRPGSSITKTGGPIVYGVTIPSNAPNPKAAAAFVEFLLDADKGMAIMRRYGHGSVAPAPTSSFEHVPEPLKKFAREAK